MRAAITAVVLAAGLALTGCSGVASSTPPHVVATQPATTAPADDVQACQAFRRAITTGAPGGQDTMGWLQDQAGNASPPLYAALQRFETAWQIADPGKIARAQRAVKRLCQGQ